MSREPRAAAGGERPAADARERFARTEAAFRARSRSWAAAVAIGAALGLASFLVPDSLFVWLAAPSALLVCGGFVLFFTRPRLVCPVCGGTADAVGPYCPVCGAAKVSEATLGRPRRCAACGRTLDSYKVRSYRLHNCSQCGALLSSRGV